MKFVVKGAKDLVDAVTKIDELSKRFLDSDARSYRDLPEHIIEFKDNIHLTPRACDYINSLITYFRGTIYGNKFMISSESTELCALFNSTYHSRILDLEVHNLSESAGFILALDSSETTFENIGITGEINATVHTGYLVRTSYQCEFNECNIDLDLNGYTTNVPDSSQIMKPQEQTGLVACADTGSLFTSCRVSGDIKFDRSLGGFVGSANGTAFYNCEVMDLTVEAKREVGGFIATAHGNITLVDCLIQNTEIRVGGYGGLVVGRTAQGVHMEDTQIINSKVRPNETATYVGAIGGSVRDLTCENSIFKNVLVEGNCIVAGLTPNLDRAILRDNEFDIEVKELGNDFIVSTVYDLVRDRDLGISGKKIEIEDTNNINNVHVVVSPFSGKIEPFEREWYS